VNKHKTGFDEFGNPIGKAFDLGGVDDERVRGESILLYVGYVNESYEWHLAQKAVSERNIQMEIIYRERNGKCPIDERILSKYQQLWMVSDSSLTISSIQIEMICNFAQNGGGLLLWADNFPYYQDANAVAQQLIKTSFSGNRLGERVMLPGEKLSPGFFIEHPLTFGVNQLFEGHTISTISPANDLKILAQSRDGQMCMACYEKGAVRVVLDTAFTKLKPGFFYKTAGTARYFRNIAFWLSHGARNVEYKPFTPGRERLATINPGASSEKYKYTITQPTSLTYVLHWEGAATLGLVIQDPQGRTVYDSASTKAPIRMDMMAGVPGDWLCWVKGVNVPKSDFPYVLTLVLHKGASVAANTSIISAPTISMVKRLPVYVVMDGSSRASDLASNLDMGVRVLVDRLRGRAQHSAAASISLILADEYAQIFVPLTEIEHFSLPKLTRRGKCGLGGALAKLNASIVAHPADSKPLVIILLTGAPEDDWGAQADQLRNLAAQGKANVFVLGVGGYGDATMLKHLTPSMPLSLPVLTQVYVQQTFEWLYQIADVILSGLESGVSGQSRGVPPPPACLKPMA